MPLKAQLTGLALALVMLPASTLAQPASATAADRRDEVFWMTPYGWAASLSGDISAFRGAPTLSVKKPFSEILNDLNGGAFINLGWRKHRYILSADVMFVSTTDIVGTGPLPALQIPSLGVTLTPGSSAEARIDSSQLMATLLGGYRVVDTPKLTLDAMAGGRFWQIANDVKVTARDPALGQRTAKHGERFHWVDPVVGLHAFLPLSQRWSLQAQADIGGFGVSASFTWSALAAVSYQMSERFSLLAGYKVVAVDYARGGHVFNVRLAGPTLGLTYVF